MLVFTACVPRHSDIPTSSSANVRSAASKPAAYASPPWLRVREASYSPRYLRRATSQSVPLSVWLFRVFLTLSGRLLTLMFLGEDAPAPPSSVTSTSEGAFSCGGTMSATPALVAVTTVPSSDTPSSALNEAVRPSAASAKSPSSTITLPG